MRFWDVSRLAVCGVLVSVCVLPVTRESAQLSGLIQNGSETVIPAQVVTLLLSVGGRSIIDEKRLPKHRDIADQGTNKSTPADHRRHRSRSQKASAVPKDKKGRKTVPAQWRRNPEPQLYYWLDLIERILLRMSLFGFFAIHLFNLVFARPKVLRQELEDRHRLKQVEEEVRMLKLMIARLRLENRIRKSPRRRIKKAFPSPMP